MSCPKCGYCPTCGRSNDYFIPTYPHTPVLTGGSAVTITSGTENWENLLEKGKTTKG